MKITVEDVVAGVRHQDTADLFARFREKRQAWVFQWCLKRARRGHYRHGGLLGSSRSGRLSLAAVLAMGAQAATAAETAQVIDTRTVQVADETVKLNTTQATRGDGTTADCVDYVASVEHTDAGATIQVDTICQDR